MTTAVVQQAATALCISKQDVFHDEGTHEAPCSRCLEEAQLVVEITIDAALKALESMPTISKRNESNDPD